MAVTYTWHFYPLDVKDENSLTDVITHVRYRVTASENSDKFSEEGDVYFDTPSSDSFTAFNSVTKDNIKSWVLADLGKTEAQYEADLAKKLRSNQGTAKIPSGWFS